MRLEKTAAEEVADVSMGRPHVVVVGAGASRASFPNGERSGMRLPVMADFCKVTGIDGLLRASGVEWQGRNFEELYTELSRREDMTPVRAQLEQAVFAYFSSMALPDEPTLYDHLLVSLRPKDVIATFNWDPFLIQAARRHLDVGHPPRIAFLHGNVLEGYCLDDRIHGVRGARCSRCGRRFARGKLLFPIEQKDYTSDPAIHSSWEFVRWAFENAFMVTIFGYGAPQSDRGAVDLLLRAWGGWQKRNMEQFEIIDIRPEAELTASWGGFIHTHHYAIHDNFYASWIANHPRRTGEAYWSQYYDARFIEANPIPRGGTVEDLRSWLEPLLAAERRVSEAGGAAEQGDEADER